MEEIRRRLIDNKPLDSELIRRYYQNTDSFGGTHYAFELYDLPPLRAGEFMVVAIDKDPDEDPIAHFCGLYCRPPMLLFFNSYGIAPPVSVVDYAIAGGYKLGYQRRLLQLDGSTACGAYCLYFFDEMGKEVPFIKFIQRFGEQKARNRSILLKHFT